MSTRTNIATQTPLGPYPAGGTVSAAALKMVLTAADTSLQNRFTFTGKEVLFAYNSDSGAHTITLTSAPDSKGRSDDVPTYSVPAGEIHAFNFRGGSDGWMQSDGNVYFEASDATVKFFIVLIP